MTSPEELTTGILDTSDGQERRCLLLSRVSAEGYYSRLGSPSAGLVLQGNKPSECQVGLKYKVHISICLVSDKLSNH